MPDYRAEAKPTPEGDGIAAGRWGAWSAAHLPGPVEGVELNTFRPETLSVEDRDRMAARAIRECELVGFWLAWHRAGGFEQLERGGWDRSTIFRKVRRFRSYFGVHPDDARFPWLAVDFDQLWAGDLQVALEWVGEDDARAEQWHERWRPSYAYRSDPHALQPEDPFAEAIAERDHRRRPTTDR